MTPTKNAEALEAFNEIFAHGKIHAYLIEWALKYKDVIRAALRHDGALVEALNRVDDWLGNEVFDDDDIKDGCTQEERAENLSDFIKQALQSHPAQPAPVGKWQGIDNAPFRERLIVWNKKDGIYIARQLPAEGGPEWWHGLARLPTPTRWQHFPAPPADDEVG